MYIHICLPSSFFNYVSHEITASLETSAHAKGSAGDGKALEDNTGLLGDLFP